ncbi:MAG: MFS transporter [Novosphingobium sp.]|nr:MFS transporter [Novosphingobium sp.]
MSDLASSGSGTVAASGRVPARERSMAYKLLVAVTMLLANIMNYADRSVLSVLAEPMKADLGITDAQIGVLYGTSFVLLNALTGIALARLADNWLRNRLLGIGVAFWSLMTALSGLASGYTQLALARVGVGVGEATISPIGHAMLADLFEAKQRSRAFSIYLAGPFVGSALCIAVGGWILGSWPDACGTYGLCSIKGWQIVFILFGLPGLVIAVLAWLLGEPADDIERRKSGRPIADTFRELSNIIPPFSFVRLLQGGGRQAARANIKLTAILTAIAAVLIWLTGDILQWVLVAIGVQSAGSWIQGLKRRDPDLYHLTVGSRAFAFAALAMAGPSVVAGSIGFWGVPLALRTFNLAPEEAGKTLGLAIGAGALLGTLAGGFLGDFLRRRIGATAPLWIGFGALIGSAALFGLLVNAPSLQSYALILGMIMALGGLWTAPSGTLPQELVLPSMRARGAAIYALTLTLIAMSTGPYAVGRLSDVFGSLTLGLGAMYLLIPVSAVFTILSARAFPEALRLREEMAKAARG